MDIPDMTLQEKFSFTPTSNPGYFLLRNLYGCNRRVKKTSYKTFTRPIMEYAATVCDLLGHVTLSKKKYKIKKPWKPRRTGLSASWHWRATSISGILDLLQWELIYRCPDACQLSFPSWRTCQKVHISCPGFLQLHRCPHDSGKCQTQLLFCCCQCVKQSMGWRHWWIERRGVIVTSTGYCFSFIMSNNHSMYLYVLLQNIHHYKISCIWRFN